MQAWTRPWLGVLPTADLSPAWERGLDLSGHTSRWIGDVDLDRTGWIVTVGSDEADQVRIHLGTGSTSVIVANADHGGIPDPYELGVEGYRDCAALLDRVIPDIAQQIRAAEVGGSA